jgi:hypothetical protein
VNARASALGEIGAEADRTVATHDHGVAVVRGGQHGLAEPGVPDGAASATGTESPTSESAVAYGECVCTTAPTSSRCASTARCMGSSTLGFGPSTSSLSAVTRQTSSARSES